MPALNPDGTTGTENQRDLKDSRMEKSGKIRQPDYDDLYPEFAADVDRLVAEGHLVEFSDFNWLHKDVRNDLKLLKRDISMTTSAANKNPNATAHNRSKGEKMPTLLYPVNLSDEVE